MIYTNTNSSFPSQVVTNEEKASWEYGLRVARALLRVSGLDQDLVPRVDID